MKYLLAIGFVIGIIGTVFLVQKFRDLGKPPERKPIPESATSPESGAPAKTQPAQTVDPTTEAGAPLDTPQLIQILAVPLRFTTGAEVVAKMQAQPLESVQVLSNDSGDGIILRGTDAQHLAAAAELVKRIDQESAIIGIKCIIVRHSKGHRSQTGLFGFLEDLAAGSGSHWQDLLGSLTYDLTTGVATFGGTIAARHALDILVQSVDSDSNFDVLAKPNLTVVSGRSAQFASGRQVPVPVTVRDSSGSETSIEYKDAEFRFTVQPTLISDGVVRISLKQSNSDVISNVQISGDVVPVLSSQTLETIVDLREDQLLYLGGIEIQSDGSESRGVPYVRKVPVLGFIFGQNDKQVEKSELSVLLAINVYKSGDHPGPPSHHPGGLPSEPLDPRKGRENFSQTPQSATKLPPKAKSRGDSVGSNPTSGAISKPERKNRPKTGNPVK